MLRFKDNVDLDVRLGGFRVTTDSYELDSPFDEFISVNKNTRIITQYGYDGMVMGLVMEGLVEEV
jgi:hypothetical protein